MTVDAPLPADARERAAALDPTRSFCVTAPAGSGKTELLSQRVLALLARAQQPEEILAITFTRKAAAEMRERIYQALLLGRGPEPAQPHRLQTWRLARAALGRDEELGWRLLQNPQRLRVLTIDGLCGSLTAQMPVLSQFGGQPRVNERAQPLYIEAVDALLEQLEQNDSAAVADSIAELLLHVDNQVERLQQLLAGLLARRDQWLPLIGSGIGASDPRFYLEETLRTVRGEAAHRARAALLRYRGELLPLLDFAATQMREQQPDAPLAAFAGCTELPGADSEAIAQWQVLADWLLTKKDGWRKTVTVKQGFPPGADKTQKALFKERKDAMLALLQAMTADEALLEPIAELQCLPAAQFPDAQWRILVHITRLLALAAAQLQLVFQSRGEIDFTEQALSALGALGSELAPSNLMLQLDARIRHLLIDEFQDTSSTQFRLLERLVEGWAEHNASGGEPQTLFIVGDGMQSIYGFREAKVGLFLEARNTGVNGLQLEEAPLRVNFRSTPTIVDWVNRTFEQAFPNVEHIARGAVPYEHSSAFNAVDAASEVVVYGLRDDAGRSAEAALCVQLVQQALKRDDDGSVAILVRYRTHLREIVPALQRAGIAFRATDIDPLSQRATIQDILALLKALLNPADRVAWLALLRSPLVGLDNADLHRLVAGVDGSGLRTPIASRMRAASVRATLSAAAAPRVERAIELIDAALAQRARKPLRRWLEGVWLALGGALCIGDEAAWRDVHVLFDLIERLAPAFDVAELEERLADLYARAAAPPDTRVLLMTVHKSKGLEFDTVILPGLDLGTRSDDKPLLRWSEYLGDDGETGLVLAARSAVGGDEEATYAWLHHEHKQKQQLEDTRLLYVAATRAVRHLYLLFATKDAEDYRGPPANCLLARIWPAVAEQVQWRDAVVDAAAPVRVPVTADLFAAVEDDAPPLQRVPLAAYAAQPIAAPAADANPPQPLANATPEARLGTAIHRVLEQIAAFGDAAWRQRDAQRKRALLEPLLIEAGLDDAELDAALAVAIECIDTMLGDERGRWLLQAEHAESNAEWELITLEGRRHVIDRSFVDADGTRWIVDYKSSLPRAGEPLADFLAREGAAYGAQLRTYRELVASLDARPIRTALYFPRIPHFFEMEP